MSGASPPGIRTSVLLRIVARGLVEHRRRSVAAVVVMALACVAVVDTSGRTDVVRRSLVAALEEPGLRLVQIVDRSSQAMLSEDTVGQLSSLGSVEWVLGLGPLGPIGRNAALGSPREGYGGEAVGVRAYVGDLFGGPFVRLDSGRRPEPGEAVAGRMAVRRLGFADGLGTVDDDRQHRVGVVGTLAAATGLDRLDAYVLVRGGPEVTVTELLVLVRRARDVEPFVARLPRLLPSPDVPLGIERSSELAALRQELAREAGALDAAVLWGALATTAAMVAALRFGAIDDRRREFGLRRSQGATRSTIGAIVVLETFLLAVAGTGLGALVGVGLVVVQTGLAPEVGLVAAIAALLTLAAVAGSVPAAVAAALRDPLEVLRTG